MGKIGVLRLRISEENWTMAFSNCKIVWYCMQHSMEFNGPK